MAAVACLNCGAVAGAGDRFCHACGYAIPATPTVAPFAPVAPPAPPAIAVAPPVASVAPPRAPTVGRRLSTGYIVGATVAFMVVMAVIASSIAFLVGERTRGGGGTSTTSPSTDVTGTKVVDVRNISVEVPASWNVLRQSADTITVSDPKANALSLRSASSAQVFALDSVQQALLDRARDAAPDARVCAGPESAAVPGGPSAGRYFVICSTLIPQGGGRAVALDDAYYFAVGDAGVVIFVMQLTASPDALDEFAVAVRKLSPPIWKLFH